jgi:hypothetical protein
VVERKPEELSVVGSIPTPGTKLLPNLRKLRLGPIKKEFFLPLILSLSKDGWLAPFFFNVFYHF